MAFATDGDILQYIPTIFDHGSDTYQFALDAAELDITRKIESEWYNKVYGDNDFDTSKLVDEQWTRATVYRALAHYIFPRLSTWRTEGDSFREQINFYRERYEEEMDLAFAAGIQYDYNGDSSINEDTEVYHNVQTRIYR